MKCFECGAEMHDSVITLHLQKEGKPVFVEGVPAKVCIQCGEEYIAGLIAEKIGKVLDEKWKPQVVISVPVIKYTETIGVS